MTFARIEDQPPFMDLNTTPLIDVMLVLLIMFIITIPIQTHAVKLDLPTCSTCPVPKAKSNELAVTRSGAILWNEVELTDDGLRYELALTKRMNPTPELHLRPDPQARYERVDQVLAIIKKQQVEKVGFVGNEGYSF